MGYLLVFWSLFSYGLLGICHKLAERKHCRPEPLSGMLMFIGFLAMNVSVFMKKGYAVPGKVLVLALICGSISLCALWTFQEGIKYGKIATSWLIINLSAAIPTVLSIVIYRESMSLKKIGILVMIVAAIVLVWLDRLEDARLLQAGASQSAATTPETTSERKG
jgi:drug/metabolite transporter (DMT)-like permease